MARFSSSGLVWNTSQIMAVFAYLEHVEAQIRAPRGVPTHLLAQIRVFSCESRL